MKATIPGETDEGIGVDVVDNAEAEHEITIEKQTNEIVYHQCESYADQPRDRTPDENELNEQARRYAKYYVYQQCGYDMVDHAENPDYVNAVREAIQEVPKSEFERYFGPLHQQIRSHHDDTVERLVDLPAGVRAEDAVVYELDVYLGLDLEDAAVSETAEAIAEARGLDIEAATARPVSEASREALANWDAVGEQLIEHTAAEEVPLEISADTRVHVGYPDARGEHQVQRAEDPLDREPDATIELLPADRGPLDTFGEFLDHHLRCQVRDCVAGMGLFPPEPFQTIGFGKFIYARRYDHYDLYPTFHRTETASGGLFG